MSVSLQSRLSRVPVMGTSALDQLPDHLGVGSRVGMAHPSPPRRPHLVLIPGGAQSLPAASPMHADAAPQPVVMPEAARGSSAHRPLRLTRRGVLVVRGVVVSLGVSVASMVVVTMASLGLLNDAPAVSRDPAPLVSLAPVAITADRVVVNPGESLWGIAARVAPGVDRAVAVRSLMETNGLASATLRPGQSLRIPQELRRS